MKITVTDSASQWFQNEMGLRAGNGVSFYGKVYGKTPAHNGFSLALMRDDEPGKVYASTIKDGVNYFIAQPDEWFFKGLDFKIDYDPKTSDNPIYTYTENGEL
ncbi:HesB/YadR/YfhF family protein [Lentilactobacillus kribbianus]|uniref:HesB/YadR/YfhF family protein n=1 Tax=Lentilactobacillus kribbianus TaxID=2729622 RepID=UPI001552E2BF|nr:iron-sulfur cluster biosynthesis protein [Lentilactobacillus kribbianus]